MNQLDAGTSLIDLLSAGPASTDEALLYLFFPKAESQHPLN
jgi:hypothetical protein